MEDKKLEKVLKDMSYSLNHIEDTMADDRALLAKLVKQNNSIVECNLINISSVNPWCNGSNIPFLIT